MGSKGVVFLFATLLLSASSHALPLTEKLALQWQKYEAAQKLLLSKAAQVEVPVQDRLISRDEWENVLRLTGDDAWTPDDLQRLREDQAARISNAKKKAQNASVIDLDVVRREKQAAKFCSEVPKGGMLHIHPGGTVDRTTATTLLQDINPSINVATVFKDIDTSGGNVMIYADEQAWLLQIPSPTRFLDLASPDQTHFENFLFLPPGKHPFPRFNGVFEFIDYVIPDWAGYAKIVLAFAQRAAREHVSYVELSTVSSPNLFPRLEEIERQTGVTIRLNNSFNRTHDVASLDWAWQTLLSQPENQYIVGIDFLDNEGSNPALEKGQLLYGSAFFSAKSGKTKLQRTMHAGEIGDERNPRDAMIMGVQRLGHGVNLAKDPIALEYAAKIHEPVEINLSSNLRLTDVVELSEHPYLNYLRLGLPVSLSTDDEGIFEIDINHECQVAIEQTDVTYFEFKQMAFNSIQTSFATDEVKGRLLSGLEKQFRDFENGRLNGNRSASRVSLRPQGVRGIPPAK